jgi:sugar lactone lactonase YvrE
LSVAVARDILVDRGQPAFDAHALALSPDGRRLYAGIAGAVLDMDFNGDSTRCPLPAVRNLVEVDGTPDVLRTDAAGRRVLWLDSVKQTQGQLVE